MGDSIQDAGLGVLALAWESLLAVLAYPVTPSQRLFWPYVLSSLAFASLAYLLARSGRGGARNPPSPGLLRFLFPRRILNHPSTWVDVRYFVPHQMVRVWIYSTFTLFVFGLVAPAVQYVASQFLGAYPLYPIEMTPWRIAAYTLLVAILADFGSYCVHYAQHHWRPLWAFHKVHHSAVVLNPLSNYREHPVDNLLYAVAFGFVLGLMDGLARTVLGWQPTFTMIVGVMFPLFAFNAVAYHLRHSHIWLRWPGWLGMVFGSPAHHQIHHSYRPEHVNKNMAFIFPVWDVLFGTYCLPEREPEMKLGLGDGTEEHYSGFLRIYAKPFRDLARDLREGRQGAQSRS